MRSMPPCKARGTTFCAAGKLVQELEAGTAGVLVALDNKCMQQIQIIFFQHLSIEQNDMLLYF